MTGGEKYWQIEGGLMKIAYINEEEAGYSFGPCYSNTLSQRWSYGH